MLNKLYKPVKGGGGQVVDLPYDPSTWLDDKIHAPSRNAIRNHIESMGFVGNVTVVDQAYGNDFTGRAGNITKPFYTHVAAMQSMVGGPPGVCITMPGTYTINRGFGFPMKDGIDHYLINAIIEICPGGYSYGSIMIYPSYVKSRIYGKGTFVNMSINTDWSIITPYVACDLEFEGIRFEGPKQLIGEDGGLVQAKRLKFKDCELISTDNIVPAYRGAGNFNATGSSKAEFENCYIKGNLMIGTSSSNLISDPYRLKFNRCHFEGNDLNSNGQTASLTILDYYESDNTFKALLKDCTFRSNYTSLYCGEGYGGVGTEKYLIIDNCRFMNGLGWIVNVNPNMNFKLLSNYSNKASLGYPVNNLMSGVGMIVDTELEVSYE